MYAYRDLGVIISDDLFRKDHYSLRSVYSSCLCMHAREFQFHVLGLGLLLLLLLIQDNTQNQA